MTAKIIFLEKGDGGDFTGATLENECAVITQKILGQQYAVVLNKRIIKEIAKGIKGE